MRVGVFCLLLISSHWQFVATLYMSPPSQPYKGVMSTALAFADTYMARNENAIEKVIDCFERANAHNGTVSFHDCQLALVNQSISLTTALENVLKVPTTHGTRPTALTTGIAIDRKVWVWVGSFSVLAVSSLYVASVVGQTTKPRPDELESERLHRQFGSFANFWQAVSAVESPEKERWIGALCLVAGEFDPRLVDSPIASESTNAAVSESTYSDINAEVERFSSEVEKSQDLEQDTENAAEQVHARECWGKLVDKIIAQRDMRSWRMMVKRSLKIVALLLSVVAVTCIASVGALLHSEIAECSEDVLEKTFGKPKSCNSVQSTKTCRVLCPNPEHSSFYLCVVGSVWTQLSPC
eukprot:c1572_g1_i1.p1 GENE.c1572_g1_i1~~c1572_g1_i1.p1  ORF type:complete len:354 (+),score=90.53 c1572_g1_i1:70-1131(+)